MKSKILALFLLAGSTVFAGPYFSFGFGVSRGYYAPPPPPPPVAAYATPYYGPPGNVWVGGYYYPSGPHYAWRAGYWARPPYVGARWYAPRYYGHRYYPGYWGRR